MHFGAIRSNSEEKAKETYCNTGKQYNSHKLNSEFFSLKNIQKNGFNIGNTTAYWNTPVKQFRQVFFSGLVLNILRINKCTSSHNCIQTNEQKNYFAEDPLEEQSSTRSVKENMIQHLYVIEAIHNIVIYSYDVIFVLDVLSVQSRQFQTRIHRSQLIVVPLPVTTC